MESIRQYSYTGGIQPLELAKKYGTPLYVYETATVRRQYERLSRAFQVPALQLNYACKANTNISLLRFIRRLGAGLDAVSIQEVELGLAAGFQPASVMFTPNCVSMEEMRQAVSLGVRINIDSISMLEQFGLAFPDIPVGIRINPHIMAGGNTNISTGHVDSKFGISIHQLPHILRVVEATGLQVEGLHMHTGSDILDANVFLLGADILLTAGLQFPNLRYMDFGSGFKVPYKPNDVETDIEEVGQRISERFREFCREYGRDLTLIFEPGKFLVSEAGTLLVRVNVVKPTPATVFLGVDSGLNHLIRPMFYNAYHHIVNLSHPEGKPRIYSVVGNICETDTFGANRMIAETREGDILCLFNAGAYGFAMASNYNSRFRPAEVLIHEGRDHLVRRRESLEDLLRHQIDLFAE